MAALFGRRFESAHLHKNPIDKIYCEISESWMLRNIQLLMFYIKLHHHISDDHNHFLVYLNVVSGT